MKRGLLLSVLIATMSLVGWISEPPLAEGAGYCDASDGLPCGPAGDMFNCRARSSPAGYRGRCSRSDRGVTPPRAASRSSL